MSARTFRERIAEAAYRRDAQLRWGNSYFTPWDMLSEEIRMYYWDNQQWVTDVFEEWCEDNAFRFVGGQVRNQDYSVPLLDNFDGSTDDSDFFKDGVANAQHPEFVNRRGSYARQGSAARSDDSG